VVQPAVPHPSDSSDVARAKVARAPATGSRRRSRGKDGLEALLEQLKGDPALGKGFDHWHVEPPRAARLSEFPPGLDARLVELCAARGIESLYDHQARFVELALAGHDVLVATPTASGKTLCYTLPILQSLLESNGAARALFLFPTKALSQDQSAVLTSCVEELGEDWHAFTYDGDTPPSVRRTLRERGHLVLTNPWMLHAGILPNHAKWSELFQGLRYIVIDEVHTLSGVFGSSVANVLRRLQRIARHYGSDPRFLCCSATLAEPAAHARRLLGRDVEVVDGSGAPTGERVFGVYNPPMLNPVAGLRANALEEARRLALSVCGPRHQTIFFCRQRTAVEVLTRYLKAQASAMGLAPEEIHGYRGGYLPLLRREIEDGLRSGRVKVVVSTNALELGIDIGALDVAVLVGYPGSQASFWQRAGRVGRRASRSVVIQIAQSDPVDQYLVRHPEILFGAPRERLGLDPDNLVILSDQVKCAAFELPFHASADREVDDPGFGEARDTAAILDYLAEESRLLHRQGDTWYWMADAYPAQDVSLGGGAPDNVLVLDVETKLALGEVDRAGSITSVHEGAIYQVEGETWIVERFDYENRRAYARAVQSDYFTEAEVDTDVRVLRLEAREMRARASASGAPGAPGAEDFSVWRGEVHVTTLATQYKKIRFYTRENVGAEDIHLPPEELDTETFVLTLSCESALALGLSAADRGSAWHGLGTLLRRVAPLFLRCQPRDLGLSTHVASPHFKRPALFLYDSVQGGVGLSEVLFRGHRAWFEVALDVASRCSCTSGCPACIGPTETVGARGKELVRAILAHFVSGAPPSPHASLSPEDE
jgi:DEAD/DEAH box helicase domain-containing protein